jgi:hypothetical protein
MYTRRAFFIRARGAQGLGAAGLFLGALLAAHPAWAGDPVGTWAIEGTLKTTACARGRCQSQQGAVRDFLVVDPDDTFAFGTMVDPSCPSAVPVRGSWKQKSSGKVKLKGRNLAEWWAAVSLCSGTRIKGRRFRGKLDPDAGTLVVRQSAHATVRGIFVGVRIRGTFAAARVDQSPGGAIVGYERRDGARSWLEAVRLP